MTWHTALYFILDKWEQEKLQKQRKGLIDNPQRSRQITETEEKLINTISLRFSYFKREELKYYGKKKR